MARTAVGYFHDRAAADAAYDDLLNRGFSRDDISVVGRGAEDREGPGDTEHHVTAGEGAAVGGLTGLLLGVAAMLIPGIGPIVAVGPIAAALAGAVTGGVTGTVVGGITGALVDAGVEEDTARYYDERFREGGVLLTVRTDDARYDDARLLLERHGGDVRGDGARGAGVGAVADVTRPTATAEGRDRIELREEELRARKEAVEAGEVQVGKEVVSERQSVEVPVTREEVVIERHPVEGRRPASGDIDSGEEIRVPLREEEVRLEKETVVTEEVNVGKRPVTETERLAGTVRHEEARIETEGDVRPAGTGTTGGAHEHRWVGNQCPECGATRR